MAKIGTVLPQGLKPYLYDSSLIMPPGFADIEPAIDESELRGAIREERKVDIRYVDVSDAETRRTVWPIALAYYDRKRLLVGWCEMRDAFRSFRTERIAEAYVLAERYPKRRKVLLSQWQVALQQEYKVDHIDLLD